MNSVPAAAAAAAAAVLPTRRSVISRGPHARRARRHKILDWAPLSLAASRLAAAAAAAAALLPLVNARSLAAADFDAASLQRPPPTSLSARADHFSAAISRTDL